jgi:hypothetical protein
MFKLPDNLSELDAEALDKLINEGLDEHKRLSAIKDDEITDEQLDELETVAAGITAANGRKSEIETEAAARAERIAAAKGAVAQPEKEEPAEEPAAAVETTTETPVAEETPTEKEPAVVTASGKTSIADRAAATQTEEVVIPAEVNKPLATIVAAANLREHTPGQELDGFKGVGVAFKSVVDGFARIASGQNSFSQRYPVAKILRTKDQSLHLTGNPETDYSVLQHAVDESRLPEGSLVAAGGWCAPSETLYGFPTMRETLSGVLSLPEVTWSRGGISFTQGPSFADIYAQTGFVQTEAQAEAGEEKNFVTIDCPEFEEARLEASGYGIRSSYLTDVTYPEILARYTEGAAVAYGHKTNARVIAKVLAKLGTPLTAGQFGSAVADTLTAFEAAVQRTRYTYRMGENATVEGFAPFWLKTVLRADLAYRDGLDYLAVTDAQIEAWIRSRGVVLQWVYDWQDFPTTGAQIDLPKTVDVALYPAGTFVKGVNDVITLDAVHDFDSMKVNTYTAMFFEEALQVAKLEAGGFVLRIALDHSGRTGAHDITSFARPNAANAVTSA